MEEPYKLAMQRVLVHRKTQRKTEFRFASKDADDENDKAFKVIDYGRKNEILRRQK